MTKGKNDVDQNPLCRVRQGGNLQLMILQKLTTKDYRYIITEQTRSLVSARDH
jgi:hypothetical protein